MDSHEDHEFSGEYDIQLEHLDHDYGVQAAHSNEDSSVSYHIDERAAATTLFTLQEERDVIQKFDRRLVLFVAFLYLLSFLDRSSTQGTSLNRRCIGFNLG